MKHPSLRFCAGLLALALLFTALPAHASAARSGGKLTTQDGLYYACFNGLTADEEYFVVVSRSGTEPLAADHLLYAAQQAASDTGTLEIPFHASSASEAAYVAAFRRDAPAPEDHTITVTGGTASPAKAAPGATITLTAEDKSTEKKTFSGWTVTSGGVTLADPSAATTTFVMGSEDVAVTANFKAASSPTSSSQPEQPASSDDSGSALLLLGAAAAVAVGVVLVLPAELSGQLSSQDGAPLPGVLVTLSQNGAIIAQTTSNAEGRFAFKVRRGTYDLTVAFSAPDGAPQPQTVTVKAPLEGLVVRQGV